MKMLCSPLQHVPGTDARFGNGRYCYLEPMNEFHDEDEEVGPEFEAYLRLCRQMYERDETGELLAMGG